MKGSVTLWGKFAVLLIFILEMSEIAVAIIKKICSLLASIKVVGIELQVMLLLMQIKTGKSEQTTSNMSAKREIIDAALKL